MAPSNRRSRKRRSRARPAARSPAARTPAAPRTDPPPAPEAPAQVGGWRMEPQMTRSQRRDAAIRAGLTPLEPGERPAAIVVSAVVVALAGAGQLIAFVAGAKVHGQTPTLAGTAPLCVLLIACAIGLWRLWYGAVLGFMALLAIVVVIFSMLLIEASNVLAVVVAVVVIGTGGYLFFKLVRVLSRIQMPRYPGR